MTATRKILELNAFDMRAAAGLDPDVANLVARRRRVFGPASMLFYARPLNLVRGEGVWLIGADGTRYLDAYNNVASVGHCHPRVVAAVSRQMATLNTHSRYLCEIVYTYAERLLATLPRELSNIVLTCTGSESVDLALRIARAVTGGTGFIVTENAYHGNTLAVTEISPSSASAEPRNPHVFLVPAPDTYRTGSRGGGATFRDEYQEGDCGHEEKQNPLRRAGRRQHLLQRRHLPGRARISWPKPSRVYEKPVACSLPTRCSRASPARAKRCGGLSVTASSPTWSSWVSPWATAIPSAGSR